MTIPVNKWTRELRYKTYNDWPKNYLLELEKKVTSAPWRLNYHIQPETGLLNDPNGFSFFNNKWHLFYQFYPFGSVHGLKSWYHLTSTNLIDWHNEGISIEADTEFDSHGVYSGSALPINDQLFITYSGNVRSKEWERSSFQMGAIMSKNGEIEKIPEPLINYPIAGYTDHVRDPQLIFFKDRYLIILGAQNTLLQGEILVFQSFNLKDWELLGPLNFTDLDMGYMIECPNLLFIDQKPLLIFCPQGLPTQSIPYNNIYPNMYTLGNDFDIDSLTIKEANTPKNLDEGFDVYATQAFTDASGRSLSISWVGLPEIEYPTFKDGWAHCLSLVKELTIKEDKLYQYPVIETMELRESKVEIEGKVTSESSLIQKPSKNSYELCATLDQDSVGTIFLMADEQLNHSFDIHFDIKQGHFSIDRSHSEEVFATEFGLKRSITIEKNQPLELNIFVDESLIEIFINKGEFVFTSRVFPNKDQNNILIKGQSGKYFGTIYALRKMK